MKNNQYSTFVDSNSTGTDCSSLERVDERKNWNKKIIRRSRRTPGRNFPNQRQRFSSHAAGIDMNWTVKIWIADIFTAPEKSSWSDVIYNYFNSIQPTTLPIINNLLITCKQHVTKLWIVIVNRWFSPALLIFKLSVDMELILLTTTPDI